jgi:hypothetical protein
MHTQAKVIMIDTLHLFPDKLTCCRMHTQTKVIMIDTLHLFPETYDLMEKARDYFKLHTNGLIFRRDFCFFIRQASHQFLFFCFSSSFTPTASSSGATCTCVRGTSAHFFALCVCVCVVCSCVCVSCVCVCEYVGVRAAFLVFLFFDFYLFHFFRVGVRVRFFFSRRVSVIACACAVRVRVRVQVRWSEFARGFREAVRRAHLARCAQGVRLPYENRGAQFTCFTSTKVQILTPEELLEPTRRALDQLGVQAWFTGRRRSQARQQYSLNGPFIEP